MYGQSNGNEFFTMKEMRLPHKYSIIMDDYIIPYIQQELDGAYNLKKREVIKNSVICIYLSDIKKDTVFLSVQEKDLSPYNYALFYQYYDSFLIITDDEDFGKYVVPNSEKLFKKEPFIGSVLYDPPFWCFRSVADGWRVIFSKRFD